ncbi:MAG TPA: GNAT family N-acetyltransferase [Anaerolineaceae bacterium]|nr:GNAT family N-acetyltransferase [Anaerolineaceae bacterium]
MATVQVSRLEENDLAGVLACMYAASREDQSLHTPSEMDLRTRYEDNHSDQWVVRASGAGVVGYGVGVFKEGSRNYLYQTSCIVHPAFRGMGIGSSLLKEQGHKAEELVTSIGGQSITLTAKADSSQPQSLNLFQRMGFKPARYYFEMVRGLKGEIPIFSLPQGLRLQSWDRLSIASAVWSAAAEAFEEHWGYSQIPFSVLRSRFETGKLESRNSVLLWEKDQLVGGCINEMGMQAREKFRRNLGWIDLVFVRKPWRKRGLGSLLIAAALRKAADLGHDLVGLNVDADNQTGAVELYSKAGFQIHTTSVIFQRKIAKNELKTL